MLLPNCPCCGSVARCDANPCCEGEGLPCALTIEYTGDGTWTLNGGLSAGDLADLEAFALQAWIATQSWYPGYSINGGTPSSSARADASNPWFGYFQMTQNAQGSPTRNPFLTNLDGVPGCYAVMTTGNSSISIQNIIQAGGPVGTSTLSVALSSGATLNFAALRLGPETSNWLMPFSYGAWCGMSSFSYEFRQPRNTVVPGQPSTFSSGWRFMVQLPGGVVTTALLNGGKVRFSW